MRNGLLDNTNNNPPMQKNGGGHYNPAGDYVYEFLSSTFKWIIW